MNFSDETLNKMGRYITIIIHNVLNCTNRDSTDRDSTDRDSTDRDTQMCFLKDHVLPFYFHYLSCLRESHQCERVCLAVTSSLIRVASVESVKPRRGVFLRHAGTPRSTILSSDGVEVSGLVRRHNQINHCKNVYTLRVKSSSAFTILYCRVQHSLLLFSSFTRMSS